MKKPSSPPSRSSNKSSFGKAYGKKSAPHKAGDFESKPRRFARDGEAGPERGEPSARPASRFGKKPPFDRVRDDRRAPTQEGRPAKGGFDRKPRHLRGKEDGERAEGSYRTESRFAKKPAFARTSRDERGEDAAKPASRFSHKPSTAGHTDNPKKRDVNKGKPAESAVRRPRPALTGKGGFQPRREPLNRQGVLLWGLHAVREAWLNPKRKCYRLWTTESGLVSMQETLDQASALKLARTAPILAEKSDIEHFLPHSSVHQGVALEVEPLEEMSLDTLLAKDPCPSIVVILDQVTDPHNVGAILRSAAALGAGAVIVTERNAPSATGIMAKTASGAAEHVPLVAVVNIARALDALKAEDFWCVGLAEEGDKDLSACTLNSGRIALVMGAEGDGLRRLTRDKCDELARLPTSGRIGSLNVSNAAAISLYEIKRQRG
ncbi:MAG: 23S rRNA (guanosine(2251)-2'-O)-methyltransferase RlmB [Alphaproteobacteria bacterium]|nr:23S rRNA (guanosine(2251)-2'-O)-methyltransferase RlmB [Alphaproteobacteria bacterium]